MPINGREASSRYSKFANAPSPIEATLSGTFSEVTLTQPLNAFAGSESTFSLITKVFIPSQPSNTGASAEPVVRQASAFHITVTTELHPPNADKPIDVTFSGTVR